MKGVRWMRKGFLPVLILLLGLSGCSSFFEGGLVVGAPTVQVTRENFSLTTERDQNGNVVAYNYTYTLVLCPLPGSGRGSVVLLDGSGNPVEAPFIFSEPCPAQAQSCPPVSRSISKTSPSPLTPTQVVSYRTVSLDGQAKVVRLPAPIEVY